MNETDASKIEAEIQELNRKATEAYRQRDFAAEDEIQSRIDALKKQLDEIPYVPSPLNPDECREHHWDEQTLRKYGNARCEKCGMQHRYWLEGRANLKNWPEDERNTRHYYEVIDRYLCKPHKHSKEAA
jgi:hypothetical protein